MVARLYRLIGGPAPTREDFLSDQERGKPPRGSSPELLRRHHGFSVWSTKARALAQLRYPRLRERYRFVAELTLPEGARVEPFAEMPGAPHGVRRSRRIRGHGLQGRSRRLAPQRNDPIKYQLLDFETGNTDGIYASREDALDVVEGAIRRNGESTLDGLALLEIDDVGGPRLIAEERDLIPLVEARSTR